MPSFSFSSQVVMTFAGDGGTWQSSLLRVELEFGSAVAQPLLNPWFASGRVSLGLSFLEVRALKQ